MWSNILIEAIIPILSTLITVVGSYVVLREIEKRSEKNRDDLYSKEKEDRDIIADENMMLSLIERNQISSELIWIHHKQNFKYEIDKKYKEEFKLEDNNLKRIGIEKNENIYIVDCIKFNTIMYFYYNLFKEIEILYMYSKSKKYKSFYKNFLDIKKEQKTLIPPYRNHKEFMIKSKENKFGCFCKEVKGSDRIKILDEKKLKDEKTTRIFKNICKDNIKENLYREEFLEIYNSIMER